MKTKTQGTLVLNTQFIKTTTTSPSIQDHIVNWKQQLQACILNISTMP